MNKSRLLWLLVAADVFLAFASVGAEAFFGWTLPPALVDYRHARFSGISLSSLGDLAHFYFLAMTVLCAFAAWIGLVCFWRHGRRLYLLSCGAWMLLVLFSGPEVTPSIVAMIKVLNALVGGAIIGLVYFSDLARRFERDAWVGRPQAGAGLSARF